MRFLILALLIALGAGSIMSFKVLAQRELNERVRSNALDTSRVISRYLRLNQAELLQRVKLIGALPGVKGTMAIPRAQEVLGNPDRRETIGLNLDRYCAEVNIDALGVMDASGRIAARSGNWPRTLPDLLRRQGVSRVFAGQDWQGLSVDGGTLRSIGIVPIEVREGGLVRALIGISNIGAEEARAIRVSDSSELIFLDEDRPIASTLKYDGPIADQSNTLQEITIGGRDFLGQYETIPASQVGTKLGFISLEDMDALTGFLQQAGTVFVLILVIMTVIGLLLGERFTGSLTKPIDQLVAAAGEMRKGQVPQPFQVGKRKDEISVLQTVFNDMVAAVEENERLLVGMIDIDPLTGILNHRSFQEELRKQIGLAKQTEQPLTMILLDLDHFHDFNLVRGHAAGDVQLTGYAGLIRGTCPGNALLGRYSGDQFGVLLPNHTAAEALEVAQSIKLAAAEGGELIPASQGVASFDPNSPNEEATVLAAELALSRAKQLGGNRVNVFEKDFDLDTHDGAGLLQRFLTDGSLATVQALAAAVDAKDQYTKGHSERVANLARDLAEYMRCATGFVELVYSAGTLHDVGKIGVPDAILSKPERLTDEEMKVMETHPVLGEVIVQKVPQLAVLLPGVRNHHERWDGRGYPDQLVGENIPMVARYLAVADTFDAMTSDRPYRQALSEAVALAEIEACAGTQFQPELAFAFAKMIRTQTLSRASA